MVYVCDDVVPGVSNAFKDKGAGFAVAMFISGDAPIRLVAADMPLDQVTLALFPALLIPDDKSSSITLVVEVGVIVGAGALVICTKVADVLVAAV